jgi:hypothetical protein
MMNYTTGIEVRQPIETSRLLSVELVDGRPVLNVEIGGTRAVARLSLARDEARKWRTALGVALNNPGLMSGSDSSLW